MPGERYFIRRPTAPEGGAIEQALVAIARIAGLRPGKFWSAGKGSTLVEHGPRSRGGAYGLVGSVAVWLAHGGASAWRYGRRRSSNERRRVNVMRALPDQPPGRHDLWLSPDCGDREGRRVVAAAARGTECRRIIGACARGRRESVPHAAIRCGSSLCLRMIKTNVSSHDRCS